MLTIDYQFPVNFNITTPLKYSPNTAVANKDWVNGSVEGVKTAPKITELKTIRRHPLSICCEETTPRKPKIN